MKSIDDKFKGMEVEFDLVNGEAYIWNGDKRVDRLDLWDLMLDYEKACEQRAVECIEQNLHAYQTAKHNWFEVDV